MSLRSITTRDSMDNLLRGDVVLFESPKEAYRSWGNLAVFYASDNYRLAFVSKVGDIVHLIHFRRSILNPSTKGHLSIESRKGYAHSTRCSEDPDYEFYSSLFDNASI